MDLTAEEIKAYLKVRDALACDITAAQTTPLLLAMRCTSLMQVHPHPPARLRLLSAAVPAISAAAAQRFTDLGS